MLIVTIAALLMAASLGWFAYRLLQEEQRRSDARVALLTAALEGEGPSLVPAPAVAASHARPLPGQSRPTPADGFTAAWAVRPVSTPDIVMLEDDTRNVRAFRSERDVRPPQTADTADLLRTLPEIADPPQREPVETPTRATGLFADVPSGRPGGARGLVAVVAVALVGVLGAGYAVFTAATTTAPAAAADSARVATAPATNVRAAGVPIELASLSHVQRAGALVVRGTVRNPVAGSSRQGVIAHVALLDAAGVIVASADAPLAAASLASGRSSSFEVRLAAHAAMRRYRVTFRDAGGAQIEHLDRRATAR